MLTFRIDDVSSNTDFIELRKMVAYLKSNFECNIWACVTTFSRHAAEGSVYPDPPFKDMNRGEFYRVGQYLEPNNFRLGFAETVSHGLFHIDHSQFQYDAQEMSIVTSCRLLGAVIFVPPFNRWNDATAAVCRHNGIRLVKSVEEGWRSLEHEEFESSHKLWYFHPWRFDVDSFKDKIKSKSLAS